MWFFRVFPSARQQRNFVNCRLGASTPKSAAKSEPSKFSCTEPFGPLFSVNSWSIVRGRLALLLDVRLAAEFPEPDHVAGEMVATLFCWLTFRTTPALPSVPSIAATALI